MQAQPLNKQNNDYIKFYKKGKLFILKLNKTYQLQSCDNRGPRSDIWIAVLESSLLSP